MIYTVTTIRQSTKWDRIIEGICGLLSVNLDQQLRAELLDVDQYAWHVEYTALTMNDRASLQGATPTTRIYVSPGVAPATQCWAQYITLELTHSGKYNITDT